LTGPTELLVLRLALIGVIFLFVAIVAVSLRGSVVPAQRNVRAASGGRARLVLLRSGDTGLPAGTEFVLAGTMTIGRDDRAGIVLADPSVSTRHASVEYVSGGWKVTDLGSTNGTFLNGRAIGEAGAVARGRDRLIVGSVELQFSSA